MKSKQPLASVIMPAYNAEKFIAQSIQSVIDQSYKNWELLVIDDGSNDKTEKVVRSFALSDKRIRYLFQEHKRLPTARNYGIDQSLGGLIPFLDADDLWIKEKLSLHVKICG